MSKSLTIIRGIYEANNLERRAHLVALNDWSGSMVKYKRIVEAMDRPSPPNSRLTLGT